jgi:hypothetical protein
MRGKARSSGRQSGQTNDGPGQHSVKESARATNSEHGAQRPIARFAFLLFWLVVAGSVFAAIYTWGRIGWSSYVKIPRGMLESDVRAILGQADEQSPEPMQYYGTVSKDGVPLRVCRWYPSWGKGCIEIGFDDEGKVRWKCYHPLAPNPKHEDAPYPLLALALFDVCLAAAGFGAARPPMWLVPAFRCALVAAGAATAVSAAWICDSRLGWPLSGVAVLVCLGLGACFRKVVARGHIG